MSARLDPVELARALVRFDTVNPGSTEASCAEHLGRLLEGGGFTVRRHEFAPGRTSVVARAGSGGGRPSASPGTSTPCPSARHRGPAIRSAGSSRRAGCTAAERAT